MRGFFDKRIKKKKVIAKLKKVLSLITLLSCGVVVEQKQLRRDFPPSPHAQNRITAAR